MAITWYFWCLVQISRPGCPYQGLSRITSQSQPYQHVLNHIAFPKKNPELEPARMGPTLQRTLEISVSVLSKICVHVLQKTMFQFNLPYFPCAQAIKREVLQIIIRNRSVNDVLPVNKVKNVSKNVFYQFDYWPSIVSRSPFYQLIETNLHCTV